MISKRKRILQVATLSMMVSASLVTSYAGADEGRVMDAWHRACNEPERIKQLVGDIGRGVIESALESYQKAGLTDRLGKLSVFEVCTSMAATSEAGTAVFVLDRSPESLAREPLDSPVPGLPELPTQKALEKQLRHLDLGYRLQDATDQKEPSALPRQMQDRAAQQSSFAQQISIRNRSYSAHYGNYCLISHDHEPLAQYSRYMLGHQLLGAMTETDWDWIDQYGDAMEFWHEVAHCQFPMTPDPDEGIESDGFANVTEALEQTGTQICSASPEIKSEYGLTDNDLMPYVLDGVILYRVGIEAYADHYGIGQLVKRFGVGAPGCRSDGTVEVSTWMKYRLMLSIYNPDLNYLTWIEPWLRGYPLPTQAASLADIWVAVNELAFGEYGSIARPRISQDIVQWNSRLYSPSVKPDSIRSAQWKVWMESALSGQP